VSFVSHVAPILISKCGRCHVNKASGEFSAATFEGLMKGSSAGTVIFAGDPDGSQLIVSIEDGDMPRGGLKISAAELATLKKWISEGAKFDGNDPKANIAGLKPGDEPVAKVDIPPPAASSGPSFGRHVAPILVQNCSGCHVNIQRLRGGLNMTTFQGLMRGGNTEPPVKPNDSVGSLLIRKLKGMGGGQRMPPGGPLSATAIARIEKWIDDGAKFDGKDPGQPIEEVADFARAQLSSGAELSEDREEAAFANWNLTMPGIKAYIAKTDNFLLVGNIGERALVTFGEQAEMVLPKVAGILGAPSTKPLIKGRMTLFVFQQRYDYSEFGRMIEKRKPPLGSRGHWRFSLIDAYGAMISPRNAEDYSMEVMIGQQLAGTYVASVGKSTPRWFAEGVAREVASRLKSDDPRVAKWHDELPEVMQQLDAPEDIVTGKLPPEVADVASYSFVKFLMAKPTQFKRLLASLKRGQDFNQSFSKMYGGSPQQLVYPWSKSRPPKSPRKRRTVGSK
jgi:hypothetical protein